MNIYILCRNYYVHNEKRYHIGGIETYIKNLLELLKNKGEITVIQQYSDDFDISLDGIRIVGIDVSNKKEKSKNRLLVRKAESLSANLSDDLLLFADEQIVCKHKFKKCIAIQHGVSWDIPNYRVPVKCFELFALRRAVQAARIIRRFRYVNTLVAVDYNFLNWYRTQVPFVHLNIEVIPNFVDIPKRMEKTDKENTTIIFARRFQWYRGTRLMAEALQRLLKEFTNISMIFAGEGPDEAYLHQLFDGDARVGFIQYQAEESLEIHKDVDIAVVPTVGSEGTSLSLLEAMACGCAVVCTNVGGMTNIVIDNFNGIVIPPDSVELYDALKSLLIHVAKREKLAENAVRMVEDGFSIQLWKQKWQVVLDASTESGE